MFVPENRPFVLLFVVLLFVDVVVFDFKVQSCYHCKIYKSTYHGLFACLKVWFVWLNISIIINDIIR